MKGIMIQRHFWAGIDIIMTMTGLEEYELQFVESEGDARSISAEMFQKMYRADDKKQKESVNMFLNKINQNINANDASPRSKLMSMYILRDVIELSLKPESKFSKLFSILLPHALLKSLEFYCEEIDPNKQIEEKGKKQFAGEPETGNNFVRCALEIIKYLSLKFPKGKNEDVTAFKKTYNKLLNLKVVFPNDYKFISPHMSSKLKQEDPVSDSKREPRPSNTGPAPEAQFSSGSSTSNSMVTQSKKI
jgi:hypothetical protein